MVCAAVLAALFGAANPTNAQSDIGARPFGSYFAIPNASSAPEILFEESRVEISSIPPGGRILWFVLGRERINRATTKILRRKGELTDDDQDGTVELTTDRKIPPASIWIFVEPRQRQQQQQLVIASPIPMRLRVASLDRAGLRDGAELLLAGGRGLDALWVRPNAGIWHATLRDGHPEDQDGVGNGRIRAALSEFRPQFPIDRSPPARIRKNDVFIMVDERTLRVVVVRVD